MADEVTQKRRARDRRGRLLPVPTTTRAAAIDTPIVIPGDVISAVSAAIVAVCKLAEKVVDAQPKDVQAELWRLHLEDLKAWRSFWKLPG